jgi:hypothetical protein
MSLLIYPDGTTSMRAGVSDIPKRKKIGIFTIAVIGLGLLLVMKK